MLSNLNKMFLSRRMKTKIVAIMIMILMKTVTEDTFRRNCLEIILMDSCQFGQQETWQKLQNCFFQIHHHFTPNTKILYWVLSSQVQKIVKLGLSSNASKLFKVGWLAHKMHVISKSSGQGTWTFQFGGKGFFMLNSKFKLYWAV